MSIRLCLVLALFSSAWSQPITVLSWNVHGGREGISRVVEVLKASRAELFLLQEAPAGPQIESAFPGWSAYRGGSNRELLILSRSPLSAEREVKLGRGRPCLLAQWRNLTVINVHFSTAVGNRSLTTSGKQAAQYLLHTAEIRSEQTSALLALIKPAKTLIGGDFNSTPKMEPPTRLGAVLRRVETPPTFPARHPAGAIDHFFVSRQLLPGKGRVLPGSASDHLPIITTLTLHENPGTR